MKPIAYIAIIILSLTLASCEFFAEKVYSVNFINNSQDTVSIFHSLTYPDTLLREEYLDEISVIYPGKSRYIDNDRKWDKVIAEEIPGKKLLIFVLPGAVNKYINPERWPGIKKDYNVLKRYELSVEDLERDKYQVNYP